jgi:hypothetical protein
MNRETFKLLYYKTQLSSTSQINLNNYSLVNAFCIQIEKVKYLKLKYCYYKSI